MTFIEKIVGLTVLMILVFTLLFVIGCSPKENRPIQQNDYQESSEDYDDDEELEIEFDIDIDKKKKIDKKKPSKKKSKSKSKSKRRK